MTSASSTTNTKKERKTSLVGFTLKQYWTSILLFTIILFFVLPVPVMMTVSDRALHSYANVESLKNDLATSWVEGIRYVIVPIMSILAVVIPCARFSYLKNKVAIDFYHSLPIKRQNLFFTQLGVGVMALFIPYIVNVLVTLLYITTNGLITSALILNLSLLTLELIVYAIFFYSLSTLVGMVSGLTAVQLVLTVVAIFILPVAQLVAVGFMNIFAENMWTDFYLSAEYMENLSPALRFIINDVPLTLAESLIMIGISIIMLGLALFLYLHRKSERAGQSVVFMPFGEVVKYILMFVGTLLGGVLFNSIMNDGFWTIFGMACGMILVFMLTNTILHKTATAMFRGIKGLIIFGSAAIITLVLLMTNAFGINSNIPSPGATSKVVVDFDDTSELTLRDKANIEAVYKIYTEGQSGMYDDYNIAAISQSERVKLEIAFYNYLGIPTAKKTFICNKSDFVNEFRTILNSEEFREQYSAPLTEALNAKSLRVNVNLGRYFINEHGMAWYKDGYQYYTHIADKDIKMLENIAEQMKNADFDYFQQPVIGSISLYSNNLRDSYRQLYASMDDFVDENIVNGGMPYTYDEHIRRLAKAIECIIVYDRLGKIETGKAQYLEITDKEQITEILRAAQDVFETYDDMPFSFIDTRYYALFRLDIREPLSNECYDMSETELKEYIIKQYGTTEDILYTNEEQIEIVFRLGATPAFIVDFFG